MDQQREQQIPPNLIFEDGNMLFGGTITLFKDDSVDHIILDPSIGIIHNGDLVGGGGGGGGRADEIYIDNTTQRVPWNSAKSRFMPQETSLGSTVWSSTSQPVMSKSVVTSLTGRVSR